jgi:cation diffusion facilitator family transporter
VSGDHTFRTGSPTSGAGEHATAHDHHHDRGLPGWVHKFRRHSHDPSDSMDDALTSSTEGIRAVKISLVALLTTALIQAVVVAVTGSVALLADTVHNFSDALTALPLWMAFTSGRRPPTRAYTYGYGRAEDLAGVFIVAMIAVSAVVAGVESIRRLLDPQPVSNLGVLAAAGLIGFAGNELVAQYRIRVGRRIGSAALVADGLHARTDGYTSLAVVASALAVWAGFPLADPLVGLAVAGAILVVLRQAGTEIYRRLMDATDPAVTAQIEAIAAGVPDVVGVGEVRLRWIGHRLRSEITISTEPAMTLIQAHDLAHRVEALLIATIPNLSGVHVHVGPGE